jgi:threonine/homoserine/homoserine lactone efflux protein
MGYRIIIGGLFILCGVLIIFRHEQIIKAWNDANRYDIWTGKFSRGGKIFMRFFGSLFAIYGLLVVLNVIK